MPSTRNFKILKPWASDAETVVPAEGATSGVAYRITETDNDDSGQGFKFKRALDSGSFNQTMYLITKLTSEIESTGILGWSDLIDYPAGAFARGSDGSVYYATDVNGLTGVIVDPVGDITGTWKPLSIVPVSLTGANTASVGSIVTPDNSASAITINLQTAGLEAGDQILFSSTPPEKYSINSVTFSAGGETIGDTANSVELKTDNLIGGFKRNDNNDKWVPIKLAVTGDLL